MKLTLEQLQVRLERESKARLEAEKIAERATMDLYRKSLSEKRLNTELRELMWAASHDLSEPLRKIQIYLSMLKKSQFESQIVDKAEIAVDRMRALLESLHAFMDQDRQVNPEVINPEMAIAASMVKLKKELEDAGANIKIDKLDPVYCDLENLEVVIMEIIKNSIKFRKENTAPQIHVYSTKCIAHPFTHHCFAIKDNGIGLDEAHAEALLRPFGRGAINAGMGIGLSICRKLLYLNHGEIRVSGIPDESTTIFVSLPIHPIEF